MSEIITEILYSGDDDPIPPIYQLENNFAWKTQAIRVLKDILKENHFNSTQLQKYYHLGKLFQNIPKEYNRRISALKFQLEKECKTRTMDTHLRIAKRTWQIFNKIGLQRLQREINITPFQIGKLVNAEFEEVLENI